MFRGLDIFRTFYKTNLTKGCNICIWLLFSYDAKVVEELVELWEGVLDLLHVLPLLQVTVQLHSSIQIAFKFYPSNSFVYTFLFKLHIFYEIRTRLRPSKYSMHRWVLSWKFWYALLKYFRCKKNVWFKFLTKWE